MWISEPTPVISSTKHIDSASSCSPKSTCSPATGTQENSASWTIRSSAWRPSMSTNSTTPALNDASAARQPSRCPQGSDRVPASNRTAAPASGRAITSHTRVVMAALVFQQTGFIDRSRPAGAENGHDDRQAHHHLTRGDHHGEKRHHLTIQVPVHAGERHERQVRGIEHQLHTHEHDNRVAAQQHPARTHREQQRRQIEVVVGIHESSPLPLVSATGLLCRIALTDSSEPVPSGSRAGASTALCRAYTPGLGSVVGCPPGWNRSVASSRWVLRRSKRSRCASTMAPRAAVISSAPVSSNAHRYLVKISAASPWTLPPALACARPVKPATDTFPIPAMSRTPKPTPVRIAETRCPRRVSASDSDRSTPISITTNRNSIITAPV